jgi:FkbM family methyltransferase
MIINVNELLSTKKIIAWGGDFTFRKSLETYEIPISYIVDNNKKKLGTNFKGYEIKSPEVLNLEDKNSLVVIVFCYHFVDISNQLNSMGLEYGKDYFHFLDFEEYRSLIDGINKELDYLFLDSIIKPGWTCLDIGANCGVFTYKLSSLTGKHGRVYSFEPLPTAYAELSRIKSIYNLSNVELFNMALVDNLESTAIKMIIPEINNMPRSGLAHIEGHGEKDGGSVEVFPEEAFKKLFGDELSQSELHKGKSIEVECTTLDALVNNVGIEKVNFIKIDTEGAEFFVLNGGRDLIRNSQPLIQVELGFNYYGFDTHYKVVKLLKNMGYSYAYLDGDGFRQIEGNGLISGEHNYYFIPSQAQLLGIGSSC